MAQRVSFDDVLGTNYVPDEQERSAIRQIIFTNYKRLVQVDSLALTAQRSAIFDVIHAHRALLSSARRLPPELVVEVFLQCISSKVGDEDSSRDYPIRTLPAPLTPGCMPLTLSRICRTWRYIALDTPQLWANLQVTAANAHIIPTWITRSRACPLSVHISEIHGDVLGTKTGNLIATQFHRWDYLSVDSRTPVPRNSFASFNAQFPLLEELLLDCDFAASHPGFDIISAPRLHTLRVSSSFQGGLGHSVLTNLRDLQVFQGQATTLFSMENCFSLLEQCPRLERAKFRLSGRVQILDQPYNVLTMAHLKSFTVGASVGCSLGPLLNNLHLPLLEELELTAYETSQHNTTHIPAPFPEAAALLARSQPPLKVLRLRGPLLPQEDVVACLRAAPKLVSVHMSAAIRVTDVLLRALTPLLRGRPGNVCPMLAALRMDGSALSAHAVATMVAARARRAQPLELLCLPGAPLNVIAGFSEVAECIEDGLELTFD